MFKNREQAAQLLLEKLISFKGKGMFVFAIPRGGVIMGKIIANALGAPFDIIVVRKIGAPNNPELAIGALAPNNVVYWDRGIRKAVGASLQDLHSLKKQKEKERSEREHMLRNNLPYPSLRDKIVCVVDDGVATGATSIAAAKYFRSKGVKHVILATPVIAMDTLPKVKRYFHNVIYLEVPREFQAVGQFYKEFPQVSDEEVITMLATSN